MTSLEKRVKEAVDYIENLNIQEMELGKYVIDENFFIMIQEYENHEECEMRYEAHKKYIDIQYIVEGEEKVYIAPIDSLEIEEEYSEEKDVMFFKDQQEVCVAVLRAGGYVVLYPRDGHKPGIKVNQSVKIKKVVGKVRV